MSRFLRVAIAFTLVFAIVAGSMLAAGCGKSKKAALQLPTVTLFQYSKGATVDFDDATINSAANAEAGFKFGIMKSIYPTIFNENKNVLANSMFPNYWRGDGGTTTEYSELASADQSTVDGTIFATKLTQAEQDIVTNAVAGFFGLYNDEVAAAKTMEQNTAYGILYYTVSAGAGTAWKTDATAWMTALNAKAAADYSGKTYAQLTYTQRKTVEAIVFAGGAGTINPEYAFWRAMVQDGFRNGNASARWPDKRDDAVPSGKTYSTLNCIEKATVDATVWAGLSSAEKDAVNTQIAGLWNLAKEQAGGVNSDNTNIYYYTLLGLGTSAPYLLTDNSTPTAAANNWLTAVNGTTPGTSENASFYAELKYGKPSWTSMLSYQYFGTDNFSSLSAASQAVVNQAEAGMFGLSVAERSPAMPAESNVIYQTLQYSVSAAAAAGWKNEVYPATGTAIDRQLAMYKWMAYEGFRNGTAATFYPTQVAAKLASDFPGRTAASLNSCEKQQWNAAVFAALGAGEQTYGNGAVTGMWGKVQAEMTDAVAMDQTLLSMTLRGATGTETSVINWKKDVETGGLSVQASFYRWMAKETLLGLKGLGTLIRLSEAEFLFKVANPNEYPIVINDAGYNFYIDSTVTGSTVKVDTAKVVAADDIWVPAESELLLKVVAPVKQMGIITWLVMAGQTTPNAQKLAADVWTQYQAGTQKWIIDIETKITNDEGGDMQTKTYTIEQT